MTGTVGTGTYKGLAQPLYGEYEQVQENVGSIMQTLTAKSGITADFVNYRTSAGSVVFGVSATGVLTCLSITQTTPTALATKDNGTTAPTTTTLTADGMFATAFVSSTARIYFRTNGTVYSVAGA